MRISILLLLMSQMLLGQEYYSKTIHFEDSTSRGKRIDCSDEFCYVLNDYRCPITFRECGRVIKLTYSGDIIWTREINWIDFGNDNVLELDGDEIIISGHSNSIDEPKAYHWMRLSVDGDSLTSNSIYLPEEATSFNNYGFCKRKSGELIVFGAMKLQDSIFGVWVREFDNEELSEIHYENLGLRNWSIWDMLEDTEGKVLFMARERYLSPRTERRNICQLHDDNTIETLYTGPLRDQDFGILWDMAVNDEGKLLMTYPPTKEANDYGENEFMVAYDQDYNEIWSYTPIPNFGYPFRDYVEIKVAKNGDFLVVGRMLFSNDELTEVRRAGYIARFSPTDGLIWERGYRERDWVTNKDKELFINDITELVDGSLIASGVVDNFYNGERVGDLWLIRVDADGCLYPDQGCEEIEFTTSTGELKEEGVKFKVFPNPNHGSFEIQSSALLDQDSRVRVIDITGRIVYDQSFDSNIIHIDLSDGLYFLSVYDAEGIRYMERLMITG